MDHQLHLTRRNLETLLSKLNRKQLGDKTKCSIIKFDNHHDIYPQTIDSIIVTAVEDEDYYTDREPGEVHESDIPKR